MLYSADVELGYTPSSTQKLGIVYTIGRFLEEAFKKTVYLHEGYGVYDLGYRLNDYDAEFYGISHIRSYIRFDFMDLLIFFLNLLKKREGEIRIRVMGNFKLLVPLEDVNAPVIEEISNSEEPLVTLQIKFPTFFRRDHAKLRARLYEAGLKRIFEDRLNDLTDDLKDPNIYCKIEPRKGRWCDLKPVEVSYLLRALTKYSLKEFFEILSELRPVRNNIVYSAGVDIPKYGEDRRRRLLSSILEFERRFTSKRAKRKLREIKAKILKETDASSLAEAVQKIQEEKLKEYEDAVEFLYISRGINDNPISKAKPKRHIKFKLWERDLEDLFTGHYSGTCIALHERRVMPLYLKDPYTEFFRIIVNKRRIGHVKFFHCRDEDGENVIHVDYIGLSGGRFKSLHDEIKRYAVTACIKYAQIMGLKKVYVAQKIIPDLKSRKVSNRLRKKGLDVYSQYLNSAKFLVWEDDSTGETPKCDQPQK